MTDEQLLALLSGEEDCDLRDGERGEAERLLAIGRANVIFCPPEEGARPLLLHPPVDPFVGRVPLPDLQQRESPLFFP